MDEKQNETKELSLETVISNAIKIPGVKVDRNKMLAETFSSYPDRFAEIIAKGPIEAGISQEELNKIARKLIMVRTSESSLASFAAGIPGGLAMAATVPADVLQFFGMSLRLAQELSYLYGAKDLWKDGEVDDERIRNQLLLYTGVMFGVSGASAGVRVFSSQIAKTTLKKLPQKALTKTFWYPLIKKIAAGIGVKVTKTTVANGIAKTIPVIGGVFSGGLTFASMMPMANRLHQTLDKACFSYSEEELEADCIEIESVEEDETQAETKTNVKETISATANAAKAKFSSFTKRFTKEKEEHPKKTQSEKNSESDEVFDTLSRLKKMADAGVITEEEFAAKKEELLKRL